MLNHMRTTQKNHEKASIKWIRVKQLIVIRSISNSIHSRLRRLSKLMITRAKTLDAIGINVKFNLASKDLVVHMGSELGLQVIILAFFVLLWGTTQIKAIDEHLNLSKLLSGLARDEKSPSMTSDS